MGIFAGYLAKVISMFDQVLNLVKQHIGNNPSIASQIPQEHKQEVNNEIAHGVSDGVANNLSSGGLGGMISSFLGGSGGEELSKHISAAVASRLQGKFGLSNEVVQKITAAIPGIVRQLTGK